MQKRDNFGRIRSIKPQTDTPQVYQRLTLPLQQTENGDSYLVMYERFSASEPCAIRKYTSIHHKDGGHEELSTWRMGMWTPDTFATDTFIPINEEWITE